MSWLTDIAPVIAAGGTVAAAVAAWRSANTSARTAKRADATSARAVEALGRTTMPRLTLLFTEGQNAQFVAGPVPVMLDVVNEGANAGLIHAYSVTRSNDFRAEKRFAPPVSIGSPNDLRSGERRDQTFQLGTMARSIPNPCAGKADGEPVELTSPDHIVIEVEFSDSSSLVVWRLRDRYVEHVQRVPGGDPLWNYGLVGSAELEIVTDLGRVDDRPVGVVRRAWRWFW